MESQQEMNESGVQGLGEVRKKLGGDLILNRVMTMSHKQLQILRYKLLLEMHHPICV